MARSNMHHGEVTKQKFRTGFLAIMAKLVQRVAVPAAATTHKMGKSSS